MDYIANDLFVRIRSLRILHDAAHDGLRKKTHSLGLLRMFFEANTAFGAALVLALPTCRNNTAYLIVALLAVSSGLTGIVSAFGDFEHKRRNHAVAAERLKGLERIVERADVHCPDLTRRLVGPLDLDPRNQVPSLKGGGANGVEVDLLPSLSEGNVRGGGCTQEDSDNSEGSDNTRRRARMMICGRDDVALRILNSGHSF